MTYFTVWYYLWWFILPYRIKCTRLYYLQLLLVLTWKIGTSPALNLSGRNTHWCFKRSALITVALPPSWDVWYHSRINGPQSRNEYLWLLNDQLFNRLIQPLRIVCEGLCKLHIKIVLLVKSIPVPILKYLVN